MLERQLLVNKLKINYKVAGQGQPVFILHGWGGSSDSWIKVQEILASQGYKVICPDFPGFGKSALPLEPWGVEQYAEWLNNFIKEFKDKETDAGEPFFFLSHSFGGRVAIKFSIQYPTKLKKLIFCGSAGIKIKPSLKTKIIFYLAKTGNTIFNSKYLVKFKNRARKILYLFLGRNSDYLKARGVMRETIKKVLQEDLLSDLPKIKTKTLIVWGKDDNAVPLKCAYLFKTKIRNSRLEILPNAGHSPHLEDPKKLSEIILNFLSEY
ncbi:MAG: alpha/beta hydrolase [Candidatus Nealsonbacteria bacterium]|nr:alpha/beta hydrolase [Candidatus Nealsonbacteria bacterium]